MAGKSPARQLPDFFLRQMQLPIYPFESPNFLPTAKNKQVCLMRSLAYNVLRAPKFLRSMHYIQQVIRESEVDVVVNFYELLTGLTYLVYRPKAVLVWFRCGLHLVGQLIHGVDQSHGAFAVSHRMSMKE